MLYKDVYTIIGRSDNGIRVRLLADSAIFKAHFPGNPVMPGVCQVGMVGELLEGMTGEGLSLSEIKDLKFMEALKPDPAPECTVVFDKMETVDDRLVVKGLVKSEERVYTKFSLIYEKA